MNTLIIKCPWCGDEFDLSEGKWVIVRIHDTSQGEDDDYFQADFRARVTDHRCSRRLVP